MGKAKHTIKKASRRASWCGLCQRHNVAGVAWHCEVCDIPVCLKCYDETRCQGRYARSNPPGKEMRGKTVLYNGRPFYIEKVHVGTPYDPTDESVFYVGWFTDKPNAAIKTIPADETTSMRSNPKLRENYAESEPEDLEAGISIFTDFHQYGPKKQGRFPASLKIPSKVFTAGAAEWVFYASNKWEHKQNFYMHEHGWGVTCYLTDGGNRRTQVPDKYRNVDTLVRLGQCRGGPAKLPARAKDLRDNVGKTANEGKGLGFVWTGSDGQLDGALVGPPYPELYCTPDGGCLLVIENKKKIRAMIWGGGMRVKAEGIVG